MSDASRSESIAPVSLAVAGLAALAVAMGIGRFAFTPILPMMRADAGLSVADGGWLASANYVGYLVGALSAMALRARPGTMIRGGLAATCLLTLGMAWYSGFGLWAAMRFAAGVASAWVLIFVSSYALARLAPLARPMLSSIVFAGVGTGIAVSGLVCLALMRAHATSAQAWIALGVLALIATVATWRVFASHHDTTAPHAVKVASAHWNRGSLRLVLCYGAFGFGYIIPATFLPSMAHQAIADPAVFGWAWPVFGAAAIVSTLVSGAALRYLSSRRLWSISQFAMAVGVVLPVWWDGIASIALSALLVGGTFMVVTMTGMQEARRVAGPAATPLIAAMTSAFALGQIAGPVAVSLTMSAGGSFASALLTAAGALAISALALFQRAGAAPSSVSPLSPPREQPK